MYKPLDKAPAEAPWLTTRDQETRLAGSCMGAAQCEEVWGACQAAWWLVPRGLTGMSTYCWNESTKNGGWTSHFLKIQQDKHNVFGMASWKLGPNGQLDLKVFISLGTQLYSANPRPRLELNYQMHSLVITLGRFLLGHSAGKHQSVGVKNPCFQHVSTVTFPSTQALKHNHTGLWPYWAVS